MTDEHATSAALPRWWFRTAPGVAITACLALAACVGPPAPRPVRAAPQGAGPPPEATAPPVAARPAEPPTQPRALGLVYKGSDQAARESPVEPDSLPLRTGELLKVTVRFGQARYPLLAVISPEADIQIVYPPEDELLLQATVREFQWPAGGAWRPLQPPDGTVTFVLLGRRWPIADAAELTRIRRRLASLSEAPVVASDTMLRVVGWRVETSRGKASRSRGIDAPDPVVTNEGFLARLGEEFSDRFDIIEAVAVPQVTRPRLSPSTQRVDSAP